MVVSLSENEPRVLVELNFSVNQLTLRRALKKSLQLKDSAWVEGDDVFSIFHTSKFISKCPSDAKIHKSLNLSPRRSNMHLQGSQCVHSTLHHLEGITEKVYILKYQIINHSPIYCVLSTSRACFTHMIARLSLWLLPNTGRGHPQIHTEHLICLWSFLLWRGTEVSRRVTSPDVPVCAHVCACVWVRDRERESCRSNINTRVVNQGFNFPHDSRQVPSPAFPCPKL